MKALEIIDKNGVSGFSARAVARAMGYTVGTLYHVFGDMDNYRLHINARILDDWHEELGAGLKRTKKDPLRYLAQSYIEFARAKHNRWTALFEFKPDKPAKPPGWYAEKMERLFALVEKAVLPHSGGDPQKARHDAKVLWAGIHGICVLSLSGKLDMVGVEKTETLVDSLLERYIK